LSRVSCRRLAGALAISLLLVGCAKKRGGFQRLAVLPFENLSADPGVDWVQRGLAEAVCLHWAGAAEVHAFRSDNLREAARLRATHVLHGYFTRAGARLRAEAVLEDARSGRMIQQAAASGEGVLVLARSLAQALGAPVRSFGASQERAFRAYLDGLRASELGVAAEALERAVATDADFGAAYVAWAPRLIATGDVARAKQVLERAGQRGNQIPELERARLAVLAAGLSGDRAAQHRAWQALARAAPAEVDVFKHLGELELALGRNADAVKSLRQAAARDPLDPWLFNQLGYAESYTRDLDAAVGSLEHYRQLRPEDANPLDSLGDVHYYLGRFAEAEKYYLAAWGRDPEFLGGGEPYKAAWARLMQGNRKGADELFEKYLEARRAGGDPAVELRRAQWEYLTGPRKEALVRLEAQREGAIAAWAQLSVWRLDSGDRLGAQECAQRAAAAARDAGSTLMARVSQYLAGPEGSAEEWATRAQRAFPEAAQSVFRRTALVYALLLSRQYAAALPLLRELHGQTPATANEHLNVLLAWALIETGRTGEVGDLLDTYAVPQPGGEQPFHCLSFPRVFRLRGIVLEKRGRRAEAQAAYRLFEALGGVARS